MNLQRPIVWVHEGALGQSNAALEDCPEAPALFVFDQAWIQQQRISRKRLGFLYECCLELPVTIRKGDVAAEVLAFAERHGADGVVTSGAVDPRLNRIAAAIDRVVVRARRPRARRALASASTEARARARAEGLFPPFTTHIAYIRRTSDAIKCETAKG